MSDTKDDSVVTTAQVEDTQEEEVQSPLVMGYSVGLQANGNFVFEILGERKGLVELLGIHAYATTQVEKVKSDATMTGDRLSHELGAVLNVLNQKLDALMQGQPANTTPTSQL